MLLNIIFYYLTKHLHTFDINSNLNYILKLTNSDEDEVNTEFLVLIFLKKFFLFRHKNFLTGIFKKILKKSKNKKKNYLPLDLNSLYLNPTNISSNISLIELKIELERKKRKNKKTREMIKFINSLVYG